MSKKTNYSYIGIALVILVFGIIFIPKIIDRVTNKDITREESRSQSLGTSDNQDYTSDLVYIPSVDGGNRKVPDFSFTNQDGKTITNEDYLGKVYLVEFFFTTCPTICPRMSKNLVQIQNHFSTSEDFGVASFSIFPETDTPEVLKAYAENYGITNPNWHLMTGDRETIYKLSNEGFYLYTAEAENVEGGFEHSGNFALIDKKGFIRSRLTSPDNPLIYYNGIVSEEEGIDDEGIPQQISILKEDIAKLLKE
ncbi:SCO family protein [Winogradskyella immobilis]|uniref:SCO family protein n=1 Tax=Winogradskyella immobilis TaxID=2816852 RepID=A0ABS8EIY8_9FLAO|nr:SCO family protein [Winogradskyella immobilis]MCC1483017.1 SCO family protein [Winogradskyella immobilis]MCG0015112.1 SCO family protein [Winogradskyella immobilis]